MRFWTPGKIRALKGKKKFATITCYDATSAMLIDSLGQEAFPIVLVGDSLGMTMQGYDSTLGVTVDEVIYHTRCVSRVLKYPMIIADLPFGAYQTDDTDGVRNAIRLIKEGGADGVKIEGGERCLNIIRRLVEAGVPVCGHIGLTPQSCLAMGGFKVQGRDETQAARFVAEAKMLEEAGCFALVAEGVPTSLGEALTKAIEIPVIGIGAGAETDAQILVWQDMLGLSLGFKPKFLRVFKDVGALTQDALRDYVAAVEDGSFPSEKESYT
jgi:3-methyl-2-oxobutanoate hydroxymethyltransferase